MKQDNNVQVFQICCCVGNSTVEEAVEIQSCSSVLLRCGSLLSTHGLRPVLEWVWDGITLNPSSNVRTHQTSH